MSRDERQIYFDQRAKAREAQQLADHVKRCLKHADIPRRFRDPVPNAPERQGDQNAWRRNLDEAAVMLGRGAIVAFVGPRGPGKTHGACTLLTEWCERGHAAKYIAAPDLFINVRETYQPGVTTTEAKILRDLSCFDLLVIDEAHERPGRDFDGRLLTILIDRRYREMKPTILISNQEPDALRDSVGTSIADRITDAGAVIPFNWPSFRPENR